MRNPGCVHYLYARVKETLPFQLIWSECATAAAQIIRENVVSLLRIQADPIARNFITKKKVKIEIKRFNVFKIKILIYIQYMIVFLYFVS